ncbi:M23 family metallopeptidase [Bacillus sp. JZ8]
MRDEEKNRVSQPSKFKKFFRKRWVYPAVYLFSAAIILTAVLWFQGNSNDQANEKNNDQTVYDGSQDAVEVNSSVEEIAKPFANEDKMVVKTEFYDHSAKPEEQEEAIVFYNNQYHQNTGVDYAREDGKSFKVTAAASGTVTRAEKDPLLGYVVEVEHADGVVTHYQSLQDVKVEAGDTVKQGQALAKAGQSLFNKEAETHVHFEVRKDNNVVNPNEYFGKTVGSVKASEEAPVEEEQADDQKEDEKQENSSDEQDNQEESSSDQASAKLNA